MHQIPAALAALAVAGVVLVTGCAGTSAPSTPAAASTQAPATPAATTSPAASYTYQDGYQAATQVTRKQAYDFANDTIGPGEVPDEGEQWCSGNDPTPGSSSDEGGMGPCGEQYAGTPWYDGCLADMTARDIP
jgi:putative hemolysin